MKNKKLIVTLGCVFILVVAIVFADWKAISAQSCRVVRIHGAVAGFTDKLTIEPETVLTSQGSCVIWFNRGPTFKVRISFVDGKKCQEMTESPSGFELDSARNCYVTQYIPLGGTSSLTFNEEGTYEYEVETTEGLKKKGAIIVQ